MEGCPEGKQIRLGTSVRRREKSQFASREVLHRVQYVSDGLRVEEVSQFIAQPSTSEVPSVSVPHTHNVRDSLRAEVVSVSTSVS